MVLSMKIMVTFFVLFGLTAFGLMLNLMLSEIGPNPYGLVFFGLPIVMCIIGGVGTWL